MIEIDGYIHTIGEEHRVKDKDYIEVFSPGVFTKCLKGRSNISMVWNHNEERILANTEDGTLSLYEDTIGFHFRCKITDPEIIKRARAGLITGCSFKFMYTGYKDIVSPGKPNMRIVDDIEISEVTLTDLEPAYKRTVARIIHDDEIPFIHHDDAYRVLRKLWEIDALRNTPAEQRIINAEQTINMYKRSR